MTFKPENFTTVQLIKAHFQILDELKSRKVVRTLNSPLGDYAEWLISKKLDLKLAPNSNSGYDACDSFGIKYQIKSRRRTHYNNSLQLSGIRNLEKQDFDYLIAAIFDEDMDIEKVLKIPHEIIGKYAKFRKHVNAHILIIRENILEDEMVEDITILIKNYSEP